MKAINYLNYFFVGIPVLLVFIGILSNEKSGNTIGTGILVLILTGLFQLIFGIKMLIDEPNDKMLQLYLSGVGFFFSLWIVNVFLNYQIIYFILFTMPFILAIFFSTITYKKAHL